MDLRQTKEFSQYLKLIGWQVEEIDGDYIFIRRVPLTPFSIIKVQRPKKIPFTKIEPLAKKHRAFAVYLEPNKKITKKGYCLSQSSFLPTKTIQLNLTPSEKKILAQMKKDARYSLRKAEKEELQLIKVKDLKSFHQAWKRAAGWKHWPPSLKSLKALQKAFGQKAIFLAIKNQRKIIAGTIILITDQSAYYYYAFTSQEGRKKLAQYLLVWEAIKLAKKKSCRSFDFEGIYDQRFPNQSWCGFSHFKKSFGGNEIKYPGCFVKHRLPF